MASLATGKVLLFGGASIPGGGDLDDTWVFTAHTLGWAHLALPTNPPPRAYHAMSSLGNSKVLLFGGFDRGKYLGDTWIFDAASSGASSHPKWTHVNPITPSPTPRSEHALALLGGSKVLLFGGDASGGALFDETWIYDASTHEWVQQHPTTSPQARADHGMANIGHANGNGNDNSILLFGGWSNENIFDDTWMYANGDWTPLTTATTTTPSRRDSFAMAPLKAGKVMLFGGFNGNSIFDDTYVFDRSTKEWIQINNSPTTKSPTARFAHAMASVGDGKTLMFGGAENDGMLASSDTWVYDQTAKQWTLQLMPATSPPPQARNYPAAAALGNGKCLLFGGMGESSGIFRDTWLYNHHQQGAKWTQMDTTAASSPPGRGNHAMASIATGQILMFGGLGGVDTHEILFGDTWIWDIAHGWSAVDAAASPGSRRDHAMAGLGSGKVLLFGGDDGSRLFIDTWIWTETNQWTQLQAMSNKKGAVSYV